MLLLFFVYICTIFKFVIFRSRSIKALVGMFVFLSLYWEQTQHAVKPNTCQGGGEWQGFHLTGPSYSLVPKYEMEKDWELLSNINCEQEEGGSRLSVKSVSRSQMTLKLSEPLGATCSGPTTLHWGTNLNLKITNWVYWGVEYFPEIARIIKYPQTQPGLTTTNKCWRLYFLHKTQLEILQ